MEWIGKLFPNDNLFVLSLGLNPPHDPPEGGIKNTDIKVFTGNGRL